MKRLRMAAHISRLGLISALAAAGSLGVAQGSPNHDDHRNDRGNDRRGDNRQGPGDRGGDFHFRDEDRGRFQSHYQGDVRRWQGHPQGRPQFARGQRIPNNYRFQPVPASYYRGAPPPPPGYQYGYYGGYVVAYNPTTRIIGDVLDLVAAASR